MGISKPVYNIGGNWVGLNNLGTDGIESDDENESCLLMESGDFLLLETGDFILL